MDDLKAGVRVSLSVDDAREDGSKVSMATAYKHVERVSSDVVADPNYADVAAKLEGMRIHGARLVVKRLHVAGERDPDSKIILTATSMNDGDTSIAIVLAIGTGPTDSQGLCIPIPFNVGDYVIVPRHAGQSLSHMDDDKIACLSYGEVIGSVPRDQGRRLSTAFVEYEKIQQDVGESALKTGFAGVRQNGV